MKKWYHSKTLWVNILAMASLALRGYYGFILGPEEEGAILVVVNLVMRAITKEKLEL